MALSVLLPLAPSASAETPPPLGVLPFQAERPTDGWLAAFIAQGLRDSIRYSGGAGPISGAEASAQWASKLSITGLTPLTPEMLETMGLGIVVQGHSQLVLNLASVRVRATVAAKGPGKQGGSGKARSIRFNLDTDSPEQMLARLLTVIPMTGRGKFRPAPQPGSWETIQEFHRLMHNMPPITKREDLDRRMLLLGRVAPEPMMKGRVSMVLAEWTMREALLVAAPPQEKNRRLVRAFELASAALTADPWQTDWLALKGEVQYFLRRDFEARNDASVARLKNPLNGLAYVILGLAAGLSTGEAAEMMGRALEVEPSLLQANRATGKGAFQEGVLEPFFKQWQGLRLKARKQKNGVPPPLMAKGMGLFEDGRWEDAEAVFRKLTEQDDDDFRPRLYLNRILIQTGQVAEAVTGLRTLSAEYPQEAEIFYFLGIALQRTDSYLAAEKAFQRSLEEQPEEPRYLYGLATASLALERWEAARETLRNLLSKDGRHAKGWLAYGICLFQLEDWRASDEAFQKALALEPELVEAEGWRSKIQARLAQ